MKILVTGGSGLLGHALQHISEKDTLSASWIFLSRSHADLTDYSATLSILSSHQPDIVIHLAAEVGGLFKNLSNQARMLTANQRMNDNVLQACIDCGSVKRVISCLSTCIFPHSITQDLTEEMIHDGPPHPSNYGYAFAKRMLQVQSRAFNEAYGDKCRFLCIIPTNLYGPHDNFSLADGHVIPALMHKCHMASKEENGILRVAGSGTPLRQFIHSYDVARVIVKMIYSLDAPEMLIVANDEECSIGEAAVMIAKAFGMSAKQVQVNQSI